jgi:hypothetical protein
MGHEGKHARLLYITDAWRKDARANAEDIEEWRDATSSALASREWPEGHMAMFGLGTSEIVGWLIANRPLVDFQPIIRVYELAQKWNADRDASRLPAQREVESQWDVADLLIFALQGALMSDAMGGDPSGNREPPAGPHWNRDNGNLTVSGKLAKRIRNIKSNGSDNNVVRILDAFQESNWPNRIDDPLPFAPEGKRKQRRTDTINSLNDNLVGMRFRADGSTEGFCWEPDSSPSMNAP